METIIFLVVAGILLLWSLASSDDQPEYMIVSVQRPRRHLGWMSVVAILALGWFVLAVAGAI